MTDSRAYGDLVDENARLLARLAEYERSAGEHWSSPLPVSDEIEHVQRTLTEAFECIDGAFVMLDRAWRFTFVNLNAAAAVDRRPDELLGKNLWDSFPAMRDSPMAAHHRKAMEQRVPVHFEDRHPVTGLWYEVTVYPTPEGIAAHWHDISARKRAEHALQQSEERARIAAEAGGTGLFEWEPHTGHMYWSDQNYRTLGFQPGEVEPSYSAWSSRVHPDDLGRVEAKVSAAQAGRSTYHDVHRIIWADGSVHVMESRAQFSYDDAGVCTGMRGTYVDITDQAKAEDALRESEARFRVMADGVPILIWTTDATGGVEFVNRAYGEFFGIRPESLGEWQPLIHPDDLAYVAAFFAAQAARTPFVAEARVRRADGEWRWIKSRGVPRFSTGGAFLGYVGGSLDITEHNAREDRAREGAVQAHFRSLFESLPGSYVVLTPNDYEIVAASDAYLAATRTTRATLIGRRLFDVFPDDPAQPSNSSIATLRASLARVVTERCVDVIGVHRFPVRQFEGGDDLFEDRWWSPVSAPVIGVDGKVAFIIHRAEDVTAYVAARGLLVQGRTTEAEHRRLEHVAAEVVMRAQELQRANERLREEVAERARLEVIRTRLLQQLVSAQEDERRRVARELHDSLGQHLMSLGVRLGNLRTRIGDSGDLAAEIEHLQAHAAIIDEEVDRLAMELRPVALDDLGLDAALRRHVDGWAREVGIPADIHTRGVDCRLPEPIETTVYRVVQEALTNVRKHARASRASVVVERRGQELVAIVEDDGTGFATDAESELLPSRHLGLSTMSERAVLVGGRLEIESKPGHGTTVYLRVPLHGQAD
jgi:PAS domain S-box-containing protein